MQGYQKLLAATSVVLMAGLSEAQFESSGDHLVPKYSSVRTTAPANVHEGECVPVMEPIYFDCPGKKHSSCTVVVDIFSQYAALSPGWSLDLGVSLDGSIDGWKPVPSLALEAAVVWAQRQWEKQSLSVSLTRPDVTRGWHVLQACWFLINSADGWEPGSATMGVGKVEVRVLKP